MVCVTGRRQVLVSPRRHASRQEGVATVCHSTHIMSRLKVNQSLGEASDISRGQDRASGCRPRLVDANPRVPVGTPESRSAPLAPAGANEDCDGFRGLRFARPGLMSDVPDALWRSSPGTRPRAMGQPRRPSAQAPSESRRIPRAVEKGNDSDEVRLDTEDHAVAFKDSYSRDICRNCSSNSFARMPGTYPLPTGRQGGIPATESGFGSPRTIRPAFRNSFRVVRVFRGSLRPQSPGLRPPTSALRIPHSAFA